MSVENKALVIRWFEEVWNKGRAEAIDEILAADGVIHGLGEPMRGPAGFKTFHAAYRNAFPDVAIRIDRIVAEGDTVGAHWSGTGRHQGDGLGFAATGRAVTFSGMAFVRVQGGRVVEGWNNFDQLGMLQQIGVVTLAGSQPAGAKKAAKTRARKAAKKPAKKSAKKSAKQGNARKNAKKKRR